MPIYRAIDDTLTPYLALKPGPDFDERKIEDFVWADLEAFTGEALFPVRRQAPIEGGSGGQPDIVALDSDARVVIIEVKRDVDRKVLAQSLEYAGWARSTNLDQLARLYKLDDEHLGADAFFLAWQDYTASPPRVITPDPRVFMIAGGFQARTRKAIEHLQLHNVPLDIVPVELYRDIDGQLVIYVDTEFVPEAATPALAATITRTHLKVDGKRITVPQLIDSGLLQTPVDVTFQRSRLKDTFIATINPDGMFVLADESVHRSPSKAAAVATGGSSVDGWEAWRLPDGRLLSAVRQEYYDLESGDDGPGTPATAEAEGGVHPGDEPHVVEVSSADESPPPDESERDQDASPSSADEATYPA